MRSFSTRAYRGRQYSRLFLLILSKFLSLSLSQRLFPASLRSLERSLDSAIARGRAERYNVPRTCSILPPRRSTLPVYTGYADGAWSGPPRQSRRERTSSSSSSSFLLPLFSYPFSSSFMLSCSYSSLSSSSSSSSSIFHSPFHPAPPLFALLHLFYFFFILSFFS